MRELRSGRVIWGLVLVGLGSIWLLNSLDLASVNVGDLVRQYWPVLLLYFGGVGLLDALVRGRRGVLWGSALANGIVLLAGVLLLAERLGWVEADFTWIWKLGIPAVLIGVGFSLLSGGLRRPGARTHWAVMGGAKERSGGEPLADMAVVAIMGGAELDLRSAIFTGEQDVLIDLYFLMGGAEIRLPASVPVVLESTSLMGGSSLNRQGGFELAGHRVMGEAGPGPKVLIRAHSIMGGAEIKQGA